jgi:hypothetical protein
LSANDTAVKWRLYALTDVFDRSFVTADFSKRFQTMQNREVLNALCFMLYARGDRTDLAQITERKRTTKDANLLALLNTTATWVEFRKRPLGGLVVRVKNGV